MDQQASDLREQSISLMEETLSNNFDFARNLVRAKNPAELIQFQTQFINRQAQALTRHSSEMGGHWMDGAHQAANAGMREPNATAQSRRKRAEES
jgi:hypothetical protein